MCTKDTNATGCLDRSNFMAGAYKDSQKINIGGSIMPHIKNLKVSVT